MDKGIFKKLRHSQFIVYSQQLEQGKSHEEALEYCLKHELNYGEYIFGILRISTQ